VRQVRDFYENQALFSVSFEGRREFGDLTAEFRAGFNRGNFDGDAARDLNATFQSGFADNTYRLGEPYTPAFGSTRDRLNPFQFRFVSVDLGTRYITDDEFVLGGDLQWDRELLGGTGFIKVGAQARFREPDYQTLDRFYDDVTNVRRLSGGAGAFAWFADEAPDGGTLATATYGPATSANGAYNYGFFFDPDRTRRIVNSLIANGTIAFNAAGAIDSAARSRTGSYDAEENIYAAYGLAQTTLGSWTLLGGVRAEFTDVSFDTFRATRAGSVFTGTTPLRASNDYVDVLPSVHARYDVNRDFVIRAALSSTLARASYRQLNPSETINTTDRSISRGRTDLDPTSSTNLDLTAEYYFSSIGLVSAGVFYKDMSDNIYQLSSTALGATLPGVPASEAGALYQINEFRNAKGAELYGFEFAFERALRFLPAPFDSLGIFANYTYADSDVDTGLPGRANLTVPLFEQVEASYNLGAYYEKHGLQVRVAYKWRDGYLAFNGFNADPRLDRYVADIGQLDITASYRFERLNLTVFTEFINVTDAPDRSYLGNESLRPAYNEYRDWQATFGLRWRL
jgi:TonB-dependent receptor